ncbi:hypothetical protein GGTG_07859 [Gaeumannomyces tritici R3-111a-1]|uniref:Uncharacterized protein n=1 Tax=Gaeumannomyces tritici (strain R3-111a-1) TaxID=644352 RepID=J3P2W7_GAET3|nr:hypothetical protein GGTG_07859 [Gaeumannomyces tritici R3-111a-1]EJT74009.1 hypothetical protein GGTG_07859 [Gaeumannomyces tritici R3-111a-1]
MARQTESAPGLLLLLLGSLMIKCRQGWSKDPPPARPMLGEAINKTALEELACQAAAMRGSLRRTEPADKWGLCLSITGRGKETVRAIMPCQKAEGPRGGHDFQAHEALQRHCNHTNRAQAHGLWYCRLHGARMAAAHAKSPSLPVVVAGRSPEPFAKPFRELGAELRVQAQRHRRRRDRHIGSTQLVRFLIARTRA